MRFDKKSRKIRTKKKNKKKTSSTGLPFWVYLLLGLIFLAFFYFVLFGGHKKQLRRVLQEKILEDMDRICAAAILFYQNNNRYPTDLEGISVLIAGPPETSGSEPEASAPGYLKVKPSDPWGSPYLFKGTAKGDKMVLVCRGADRKEGGTGDNADVIRQGCKSTGLPPP